MSVHIHVKTLDPAIVCACYLPIHKLNKSIKAIEEFCATGSPQTCNTIGH